jgi:hypothetical protein
MADISAKHGKWADLMKEVFNQLKENKCDVEKITDCLKKPKKSNKPPSHYTTSAFASN